MKLKIRATIPDLEFKIANEQSLVEEITTSLASLIARRTAAGQDARGAMPRPKDGGPPLRATGALAASIVGEVRQSKSGRWTGIVKPTGKREDENVAGKKKAAALKTRQLRAAASIGSALQRLTGGRTAPGLRLSRIRVRTADTNAALAGILSTEPKDARGISGGRGIYRIFELKESETEAAARIVRERIKPELEKVGERIVESK